MIVATALRAIQKIMTTNSIGVACSAMIRICPINLDSIDFFASAIPSAKKYLFNRALEDIREHSYIPYTSKKCPILCI